MRELKDISKFWIAGINYKKTDATVRGQFAIQKQQYISILKRARAEGLNEVFVLSTCNRTEIYGFAEDVSQLINLLCSETAGDKDTFNRLAYLKNGVQAVEHFFYVSAGLDSQILGDYEIVGQIKASVKLAKEHGCINVLVERLVNTILQ